MNMTRDRATHPVSYTRFPALVTWMNSVARNLILVLQVAEITLATYVLPTAQVNVRRMKTRAPARLMLRAARRRTYALCEVRKLTETTSVVFAQDIVLRTAR